MGKRLATCTKMNTQTIKDRAEAIRQWIAPVRTHPSHRLFNEDIPLLIQEVERLQGEVERLSARHSTALNQLRVISKSVDLDARGLRELADRYLRSLLSSTPGEGR